MRLVLAERSLISTQISDFDYLARAVKDACEKLELRFGRNGPAKL